MSQAELSRLTRLSTATISRIEAEQQIPTRLTAERILAVLNASQAQRRAVLVKLNAAELTPQNRFNALVAEHQDLIANYEAHARQFAELARAIHAQTAMIEQLAQAVASLTTAIDERLVRDP